MNYRASIAGLCGKLGMSRQNYYQGRKRREKARLDADLACRLVRRERALQPRLGDGNCCICFAGNWPPGEGHDADRAKPGVGKRYNLHPHG